MMEFGLLDTLARWTDGPCVSLYLPVDRRHPDDHRDHTELKVLATEARDRLLTIGTKHLDELDQLVETALARESLAHRNGTRVFFAAPGFTRELFVADELPAFVAVEPWFHVAPLVRTATVDRGAYVLVVGSDTVSLARATTREWEPCDVPDLPRSLADTLWYERMERHAGAHGGGPAGSSGALIRHGSGAQNEDRKRRVERYLHHIDETVLKYLGSDHELPLVVAGSPDVVARYRAVSHHSHVVAAPIGSPAELTDTEVRERVAPVLMSLADDADAATAERLAELAGTGWVSADITEVTAGARDGRVETMFLGSIDAIPGLVGDTVQTLASEAGPVDGVVDLLNLAVVETLRHSGEVRTIDAELLPGGGPVLAAFRY